MLAVVDAEKPVNITFQQWLKFMRDRARLSQKEVAEALGLKIQTVGNWEGGRSTPKLDPNQTFTLCNLLGVSLADFAAAFRGEIELRKEFSSLIYLAIQNSDSIEDMKLRLLRLIRDNKLPERTVNEMKMAQEVLDFIGEYEGRRKPGTSSLLKYEKDEVRKLVEELNVRMGF